MDNKEIMDTVSGDYNEATENTHTAVVNVLMWIKEHIKSYRYTGKKSKEAYNELIRIYSEPDTASFGDFFTALTNFYNHFDNNPIMCSRRFYASKDEIRTDIVDLSFVVIKCSYMGKLLDVPVVLGYLKDFNFPYYKKCKEEFLKSCKQEYTDFLNKKVDETLYDARYVSETSEKKTLDKKVKETVYPALFIFAGIIIGLFSIYNLVNLMLPFNELSSFFENSSDLLSGFTYIFESKTGVSHNSLLMYLVLILELIIIVCTIRLLPLLRYNIARINNEIIVSLNKTRLLALKKKELEKEVGLYEKSIDKLNFSLEFKSWFTVLSVKTVKKKTYKSSLILIILCVLIIFSTVNTAFGKCFFVPEKYIRDIVSTAKLECSVFCTAKEEITIYEKKDINSFVRGVIPVNREYMRLDHKENDAEFIRVKYEHDYGYSEGWMRIENYRFSAPYEMPENYVKLGFEKAEASSSSMTFTPDRVIDSNLASSWRPEDGKSPLYQSLFLTLLKNEDKIPKVKVIGIAPGNCYSEKAFINSGRPETATLTFINGDKSESVEIKLDDYGYFQFYSLNRPVKAQRIYLKISSYKEGEQYPENVYVSEVSAYSYEGE